LGHDGARADLVAGDDALQKPEAVESALFGQRECSGDDVDRRVTATQAIPLVDFQRDAGRRVRERRPERV